MLESLVYLSDSAFLSILASSIESYPSKYGGGRKEGSPFFEFRFRFPEGEVFGLLFGQRILKNNLIVHTVQFTIPMHVLEVKNPTSVGPSYRHLDRIRDVLEAYPMIQYLGAFHSHPFPKSDYKGKSSASLSEEDIKSALDEARGLNEDSLEMVIGLTRLDKTIRIAPKIGSSSVESYCGNYKYTLSAYSTQIAENTVNPVTHLICPLASGFSNSHLYL